MHRKLAAGMIVLGVGAMITGCSTELSGPPEITGAESLREAYVYAGGTCNNWDHHDSGTLSSESGVCRGKAALSFFDDPGNMDLQLYTFDELELGYLSGDDWVISTSEFDGDPDSAEAVARKMGGTYTSGL